MFLLFGFGASGAQICAHTPLAREFARFKLQIEKSYRARLLWSGVCPGLLLELQFAYFAYWAGLLA